MHTIQHIIDCIISRLKWLETIQCRMEMEEATRVEERIKTTQQLRDMLQIRDINAKLISLTEDEAATTTEK